jgi:hypothetical protein
MVADVPAREAFWRRIHPDDRDRVYENLLTAARQKRDYVVEHRIVWPDGTVKYHQAIGHPVLDATGETAPEACDGRRQKPSQARDGSANPAQARLAGEARCRHQRE